MRNSGEPSACYRRGYRRVRSLPIMAIFLFFRKTRSWGELNPKQVGCGSASSPVLPLAADAELTPTHGSAPVYAALHHCRPAAVQKGGFPTAASLFPGASADFCHLFCRQPGLANLLASSDRPVPEVRPRCRVPSFQVSSSPPAEPPLISLASTLQTPNKLPVFPSVAAIPPSGTRV